jgi:hypothetical protein
MYTNTVFSAALPVVPGSPTPISCPTTKHVLASQKPGVYVLTHKALHCWHADHALCTKVIIFIVLKI